MRSVGTPTRSAHSLDQPDRVLAFVLVLGLKQLAAFTRAITMDTAPATNSAAHSRGQSELGADGAMG